MKIAVDLRVFSSWSITGVGHYTYQTLSHLLALDKHNSYQLFFNSHKTNDFIKRLQTEWGKYPNVEFCLFNYPNKLLNASLFFFQSPKLDQLANQADLFWFPNFNFWHLSSAVKSIVTVHDLSFANLPMFYSLKMRAWHWFVSPAQKLKQANKIIAVSQNTKNDLKQTYGLPDSKIKVIYSGINQAENCELEAKDAKINLPGKFILFLGTLEPRKNIIGLIRAFEFLNKPEYSLVIAGGRGWLYKKIYQVARKSFLRDKIVFINYPSDYLVQKLYAKASLLVWPSFYEGFGFPPLQAMSRDWISNVSEENLTDVSPEIGDL